MTKLMLAFNVVSSILCVGLFLCIDSDFRYTFLFNALAFLCCVKMNIETIELEKQIEKLEQIKRRFNNADS